MQYSGSPVNIEAGADLVAAIYGGEDILNERTKNGISDVYRSHTNPGDPVSVFLGGNSAGVNNQEGYLDNFMYAITRGVPTIANGTGEKDKDGNYIKDPSPHSGYPCVIGCGDDMVGLGVEIAAQVPQLLALSGIPHGDQVVPHAVHHNAGQRLGGVRGDGEPVDLVRLARILFPQGRPIRSVPADGAVVTTHQHLFRAPRRPSIESIRHHRGD